MSDSQGLIEAARGLTGGVGVSILGIFLGRSMYHISEVRKKNRRLFGKELLWELPAAFGMGFIAEAISSYYDFNDNVTIGIIIFLAYMGPRGLEALLVKWLSKAKI
tara:strand:- start:1565 stop:1882 length:318 start_codon:yes stop_codon:yes gene_type:complete